MVRVPVRTECEDQNNKVSGMMEGQMDKNVVRYSNAENAKKRWIATSSAHQELCSCLNGDEL